MNTKMNQLLFYVKRQLNNRQFFLYCKFWEFTNCQQKKFNRKLSSGIEISYSINNERQITNKINTLLSKFTSSLYPETFIGLGQTMTDKSKFSYWALERITTFSHEILKRYFGFVGIGMYD